MGWEMHERMSAEERERERETEIGIRMARLSHMQVEKRYVNVNPPT